MLFFWRKNNLPSPPPPPSPTPTTTTTFSFNVEFIAISYTLFGKQNNIRGLKQQPRRRLQKRHLERELVPPQILSRLFHLV